MDTPLLRRLTEKYAGLRLAILGDFCLDRYLEIDPARQEISLETGLPVHNVVRVRPQPGGAGTILNNLCALGVGRIYPVGFCGEDGEGAELCHALERSPGVQMEHFLTTAERRTFTYCKPLLVAPGKPPVELNRLDSKNWTPTPAVVQAELIRRLRQLAPAVDAIIVLDQVDVAETGVVTQKLLATLKELSQASSELLILADSRRGLGGYPPVIFKMNAAELAALAGLDPNAGLEIMRKAAGNLARLNQRLVFVTLSERGLLGASPTGQIDHVPALPVRGEIDIVGAGDAVTANLTAALAAAADLRSALELANAAASVVVHKLGTTGTASVEEIARVLATARA